MDLRLRLRLPPRGPDERFMCVIVERSGELYALIVDDVGDVLWLTADLHEPAPAILPAAWRQLCTGLYRMDEDLLLALDPDRLLALEPQGIAA